MNATHYLTTHWDVFFSNTPSFANTRRNQYFLKSCGLINYKLYKDSSQVQWPLSEGLSLPCAFLVLPPLDLIKSLLNRLLKVGACQSASAYRTKCGTDFPRQMLISILWRLLSRW